MMPAFLRVAYAPFLRRVFKPFADAVKVTFLPISGTNTVFFWRLTWRRRFPVGLNCVARVRLEYPPPTIDVLPVMSHFLAITRRMLPFSH